MRNNGLQIFVLDATAFIRLDFPDLLAWAKSTSVRFYTTPDVTMELKDFRSRTNLDILKQSGTMVTVEPSATIARKVKRAIQAFDPQTSLSRVDIGVLSLAIELKEHNKTSATLITSDYRLQNAAGHLDVPFHVMGGQKIIQLRRWQLKCRSCKELTDVGGQICPSCGGQLFPQRSRGKNAGKE